MSGTVKMQLSKIEHLREKGKVDKLAPYTDSPHIEVRRAVYEALGQIDKEESANLLIAGINDEDPSVRLEIAKSLSKVGTAHAEEMIKHRIASEKDEALLTAFREAAVSVRSRR